MSNTDIFINGVKIPPPDWIDGWVPSFMDLVDNSQRVGGLTMRFNYLGTKRQWDARWSMLTKAEYESIMTAIEGVPMFPITCYDPSEKGIVTKTFYKGDRKFPSLFHFDDVIGYGSIQVTFIEQ
jgi:hypothetical protein